MQVTCSGTKDVLWVGVGKHGAVEKDQAKQGQWSQTELPSDEKKKNLGIVCFQFFPDGHCLSA